MALSEGEKYGAKRKGKGGAIIQAVIGPTGKIARWETVEAAPAGEPESPAPAPRAPKPRTPARAKARVSRAPSEGARSAPVSVVSRLAPRSRGKGVTLAVGIAAAAVGIGAGLFLFKPKAGV